MDVHLNCITFYLLECQSQVRGLLNSNSAFKHCATYAQLDYLFLCGLRKSFATILWNFCNCMSYWSKACRYNNTENGTVDKPTLLLLHVSQTRMFQWLDMFLDGRNLIPGSSSWKRQDVVFPSFFFCP